MVDVYDVVITQSMIIESGKTLTRLHEMVHKYEIVLNIFVALKRTTK